MYPTIIVIFGATGDLARHKLFPAFFKLYQENRLPQNFKIIAFARKPYSDQSFQDYLKEGVMKGESGSSEFLKYISYHQGNFEDKSAFISLKNRLNERAHKLLYIATPPNYYSTIIDHLTALAKGERRKAKRNWTRIVIEKPFGSDLKSAQELEKKLHEMFDKKDIFRVDHYLSKETVQNILVFRFANGVFEPVWHRDFIDHVQITVAEEVGIGNRGALYEATGALRDVVQNHVLNLLSLTAMEMPASFSSEDIAAKRFELISHISYIEPPEVDKWVVRGQYEGYQNEKNVSSDSSVETFVSAKLVVDNDRWRGVPFYIRTGKKLAKKISQISIHFRSRCELLFAKYGCPEEPNILRLRIEPDEGIGLTMIAKEPGHGLKLSPVNLHFRYQDVFAEKLVESYERVIVDILAGDRTLFSARDGIEASWKLVDGIIGGWKTNPRAKLYSYKKGSWGPKEAEKLIEKDGRKWI